MPRFVVLLRGVNVGRGNRLPMAAFKSLLETLGYTGVATLLNSGNAVFSSPGRSAQLHASAIADALAQTLGLRVATVVKSAAAWAAIVAACPFDVPAAEHARLLAVLAADDDALQGLQPLQALAQAPERLVIGAQAAYLHCTAGLLDSRTAAALLGKPGQRVTTRNWATVLKLAALVQAGAA